MNLVALMKLQRFPVHLIRDITMNRVPKFPPMSGHVGEYLNSRLRVEYEDRIVCELKFPDLVSMRSHIKKYPIGSYVDLRTKSKDLSDAGGSIERYQQIIEYGSYIVEMTLFKGDERVRSHERESDFYN